MRVLKSILMTLGLVLATWLVIVFVLAYVLQRPDDTDTAASLWIMLLVLPTSVWAAISSHQLEFRRYKTTMDNHPVTIFIVHLLLWLIAFPWFLTVRASIKEGSAELKDAFKRAPYPSPASRAGGPGAVASPTKPAIHPVEVDERVPPPLPPVTKRPSVATPAPAPVSVMTEPDRMAQLQKLADFKAQGVLTEEEFQAEKRRLLG